MKYLILFIITLVMLIPALYYDFTVAAKSKKDITVSEKIYRFDHRNPIVVVPVIAALIFFFPSFRDIVMITVGVFIGHLLWKA